jgi:hypothetical protein|tara:strand:- start:2776 stop:4122 length:1347 start_codon:yes stop_codon:yes gene_type:complete
MNSELKQKKLFFKAREYMDKLKKSEVDTASSSYSYLTCWGETVGYARLKIWINGYRNIFQYIKIFIKNLYVIGCYSDFRISKNDINLDIYKKLIISWSFKDNFSQNGEYHDRYFNLKSSQTKNTLWLLLSIDNIFPANLDLNVIILYRKNNKFNLIYLIKQIACLILEKNFNMKKIFHELSFNSFLSKLIVNKINKRFDQLKFESILTPYEGQPFQQTLNNFFKKKNQNTITQGYIHNVLTPFPGEYFFRSGAPDQLLIHGLSMKGILEKYLGWPKEKIKIIKSFMKPIQNEKNNFENIYLPYELEDFSNSLKIFEKYLELSEKSSLKNFEVKIHPANLNCKKNLEYKKNLEKVLDKYNSRFSLNSFRQSISIVFGFSSLIVQLLENNKSILQITTSPEFEVFFQADKYWDFLTVEKKFQGAYFYSLSKKSSFIDYSENMNKDFFADF